MKLSLPFALVSLLAASLAAAACGDDDATPTPTSTSTADAGPTSPTDGGGDIEPGTGSDSDAATADAATDNCAAATTGLMQTADANAPVLDAAKSSLVRVNSNDAFCAGHGGGKFPSFGAFGYQLSVFSSDADGDGRTSLDDVQADGAIRLMSDPNVQIMTKTDPKHFGTGGQAVIIQLCLDKVYAAKEIAIGVDLSDKANHRAKAICVRQQSGG